MVLGLLMALLDTAAFIGLNQDVDVFLNYAETHRVYLNDSETPDPSDTNVASKHGNSDIFSL